MLSHNYPDNITGLGVAKRISPSPAKRAAAMALDGVVADLADPLGRDEPCGRHPDQLG